MAKRKRLTPANPDFLTPAGGLENKGMFLDAPVGKAPDQPARRTPPIAGVAAEAAATAALEEISSRLSDARQSGRLVIDIPLADIHEDYIERDRLGQGGEDMIALKQSLIQRGQQTPIEVVALPAGGYGLISGWRRYRALLALSEETGEARFAQVLALLRRPEDMPATYLAMVEENEIRANLSHFERARIVAKSVEHSVFVTDKAALNGLFGAASRAKRSKIKAFLPIVRALDGALRFPEALSERSGLTLSHLLQDMPTLPQRLSDALRQGVPQTVAEEQAILAAVIKSVKDTQNKQTLKPGLESVSALAEIVRSVTVSAPKPGELTLAGPGVDAALRSDLVAWLQARAAKLS